jgi:hypothetical protein
LVCRRLAWALAAEFLGPGRDELVAAVEAELRQRAKGGGADLRRLERRAAELDREAARLLRAIRQLDDPGLVAEYRSAVAERDAVRGELQRAGRLSGPEDLDAEANATADGPWALRESLTAGDPATLREVFHQLVYRIDCTWERVPTKTGNGERCRLAEGRAAVWELGLSCLSGNGPQGGAYRTPPHKRRTLVFTAEDLDAVA